MSLILLQSKLLKVRNANRGIVNSARLFNFYITQVIEHTTLKKASNALLAKTQKYLKRDKLVTMPYRYTIDILNVCNLRCPLCPTGLGTLKRDRGRMSLETFQGLIDQVEQYAYLVELYNWGEPFLHRDVFEMISYASQRKISVRLSSNLNRFDEEMARKTVEAGLDAVIVSVDGATQETYEKYRRNGNLERVLNNIRLLVKAKKEANRKNPFIIFRMLINKYNEHEIESMRKMAIDLGVDAFTTGVLYVDTNDKIQIETWLPTSEELSSYDYSSEHIENVWHCSDLWESVTINWDGGLAPCCWLHDRENDFANAFEKPLTEIWNGDEYVSSRRVFAFGGAKDGPAMTICTRCKGRPQYLKD